MPDEAMEEIDEAYLKEIEALEYDDICCYLIAEFKDTHERIGTCSFIPNEDGKVYDIAYCVHKNYATLIPIQISVYKDKIYIGNECVFPEDWTVDNLLGKHNSRPYNPLIANAFFRAGYIESWGRGIQKIRESCEENGNAMAEYKVSSSEMMVMFKGLDSTTNQGTNQANQGTDQTNEVKHKILKAIELNRSIS